MLVHSLILKDYRNYPSLELKLSKNINVFLGANAQGKTNLIEAVYYASMGYSHRTRTDGELISWNHPNGMLKMEFQRMNIDQIFEFRFSREKRRSILLNGHPIRPKELVGTINTILFSPEDLFLIKGAPSGRRSFLDREISQASPSYYQELLQYNRILLQRNTLLKRIKERSAKESMLEPWDVQLLESATKLIRKRQESVKKINMLANLMQRRISDNLENLSVSYEIRGFPEDDMTKDYTSWYNEALRMEREKDILRGSTSLGPHHDDLILEVNGINLRSFGSQGQQRTGALALKLAELEFLHSETGEYPILLLDDVMSELDQRRRKQLMEFLRRERIQTFITATDRAYFPKGLEGVFYEVKQGNVFRMEGDLWQNERRD